MKLSILFGAVLCCTAVAVGAFGAHLLSDLLDKNQRVDVYQLANRYHFYHGLGLLVIGAINWPNAVSSSWVVWPLFIGTLIFCGSLYLLAITNLSWLGAVTPIGGLLLLLGWGALIGQTVRARHLFNRR